MDTNKVTWVCVQLKNNDIRVIWYERQTDKLRQTDRQTQAGRQTDIN